MGTTVVVAVVAFFVVAAVTWPLMRDSGDGEETTQADEHRGALRDDIDQSLRAIREIDFDHKAGNLSDADYVELDRGERARAADLLRQRDSQQG